MNRTIKNAAVKRSFYDTRNRLKAHWNDFLMPCNFARRLKTLKGLTPTNPSANSGPKTPSELPSTRATNIGN